MLRSVKDFYSRAQYSVLGVVLTWALVGSILWAPSQRNLPYSIGVALVLNLLLAVDLFYWRKSYKANRLGRASFHYRMWLAICIHLSLFAFACLVYLAKRL